MRKTTKSTSGTSFHDTTVGTTVHTLRQLLGEPDYEGNNVEAKTNFEWNYQTSDGDVFTVYDWKKYRPLDEHEIIEFHIGGKNKAVTEQAKNEIYDALESYSKKAK